MPGFQRNLKNKSADTIDDMIDKLQNSGGMQYLKKGDLSEKEKAVREQKEEEVAPAWESDEKKLRRMIESFKKK